MTAMPADDLGVQRLVEPDDVGVPEHEARRTASALTASTTVTAGGPRAHGGEDGRAGVDREVADPSAQPAAEGAVGCSASRSARSIPSPRPAAKTRAGSSAPCQIDGRAIGCSTVSGRPSRAARRRRGAQAAQPPVPGLGDPPAGSDAQQQGEQREAEQRDGDDHGVAGAGDAERRGGLGVEGERDVDAVAEQPDVDGAAPEDQPVGREPELCGPDDRQRHQRDRDADGDGQHGLEGREAAP